MEWVERANSESAPNCPTRIETRSPKKFCCNQSSFIRTVGKSAILLTVKILPTCSGNVLAAQPIPPCGKASASPSKQLLKINVSLKAHQAGINGPGAYAAGRVTPNLTYILRIEGDSFVRNSCSESAQLRSDSDEFMFVIAILPVASLTVPVTVMMVMPIFVIPVVISTIFIGKGCQRSPTYQS